MSKEKRNRILSSQFHYLLDTSAIIAYLSAEKGGNRIKGIKNQAALPFIALSELYYVIWNRKGKAEADRIYGLVKSWHLSVLMPSEEVIITAGRLKTLYKLGIADSYIAAFASVHSLELVTKDKDYNILNGKIKLLFI